MLSSFFFFLLNIYIKENDQLKGKKINPFNSSLYDQKMPLNHPVLERYLLLGLSLLGTVTW